MECSEYNFTAPLAICALILLIYYDFLVHRFWASKGVPGPKPSIFFGNINPFFGNVTTELKKIHSRYAREPFVGIYIGKKPYLMLHDADIIKQVLVKDFEDFADRGMDWNGSIEPLTAQLFNIDHVRWKCIREKLAPTFTGWKMKTMFPLVTECAEKLREDVEDQVQRNDVIGCQDLTAKFTVNVIGSSIFGIDVRKMEKAEVLLRKVARKILQQSSGVYSWRKLARVMPGLFRVLRLGILDTCAGKLFRNILRDVIDGRMRSQVERHDFIDVVLQVHREQKDFEWLHELVAAQAFVFFVSGRDTSTTVSCALYELAQAAHIQERLRDEIQETMAKSNGEITYEGVVGMTYLDMVLKEVLRKHPPLTEILRQTTKPCLLPNTDVMLPSKTKIIIPTDAIYFDSRYYPNPEVFDPERFSAEGRQERSNFLHLPFGNGSRNCIGTGLAKLQSKLAIITILNNYRICICEETVTPSSEGIKLRFEKLFSTC